MPHIVGDDDEMSDVDDQAQMSDAVLDGSTPQETSYTVTESSNSVPYDQESESSSSSDSSDDGSSDSE